jgi:hypothetical protein
MRTTLPIFLVLLLVAPSWAGGGATKLLQKLKTVDGAGSGLDADRLQGLTPRDLVGFLAATAYQVGNEIRISPNSCQCVDARCEGNDFLVHCGGGFLPHGRSDGYLTATGQLPLASVNNVCETCGCNTSPSLNTDLAVTAICLAIP